jgi:hypothetical protein
MSENKRMLSSMGGKKNSFSSGMTWKYLTLMMTWAIKKDTK